jgi:hypothetical protein
VDRHGDAGGEERERLRRSLRIEMPRPEFLAPPPDGKEREVERGEAGHAVEEIRVSGEVHPLGPGDGEAE